MDMQDQERILAMKDWLHLSRYWHLYSIIAFVIISACYFFGYRPTVAELLVGFVAGVSIFLRSVADCHGRRFLAFLAALGTFIPTILLAPRFAQSENGYILFIQFIAITTITGSLMHGIFNSSLKPNIAVERDASPQSGSRPSP